MGIITMKATEMVLGNDYCLYCYDNIKNYDEDGVDCSNKLGSSCPVCKS